MEVSRGLKWSSWQLCLHRRGPTWLLVSAMCVGEGGGVSQLNRGCSGPELGDLGHAGVYQEGRVVCTAESCVWGVGGELKSKAI